MAARRQEAALDPNTSRESPLGSGDQTELAEAAAGLAWTAERPRLECLKAAWRWRVLYLRGLIDSELCRRHDKMEGAALKEAFDELTGIYHAENVHGMPVRPPQVSPTGH
jgi:hypothetical protein